MAGHYHHRDQKKFHMYEHCPEGRLIKPEDRVDDSSGCDEGPCEWCSDFGRSKLPKHDYYGPG